jgi:hypothetical protein
MGDMNEMMDATKTSKVMTEFARQNEYMNVKEDLLDDALMDAVSLAVRARVEKRDIKEVQWILLRHPVHDDLNLLSEYVQGVKLFDVL